MNMKKIFLLFSSVLLIAGVFSGCNIDEKTGTNDNGDLLQGPLGAPGKRVESYDGFIGCGYDVINSPYYQSDYVKQCPLNVDKMAEDGLIYEDINAQSNTTFVTEVGENIHSYMNTLAVNAGVQTDSLFGGSIKVDFGLNTSSKVDEKQSFAKGSAILTKKKQYVHMSKTTVEEISEKYVYPNFRDKILLNDKKTPAELFESYGTHIMLSVSLGGRLDMCYVYNNITRQNVQDISASVEASYGFVSAKTSTEMKEDDKKFVENSSLKIKTYGGKVGMNLTTLANVEKNYQEWSNSIDDTDFLSLVKAGNLATDMEMFPIWMLIDTDVDENATQEEKEAAKKRKKRQDAIKAEYERMLEKSGKNLEKYQDKETYIKDIYFGAHGGSDQAKADLLSKSSDNINILDWDLNMKAGGNFIYLGYTTTTNPNEAIRDIVLHFHRKPKTSIILENIKGSYAERYDLGRYCSKYYVRSEYDLNKGAGGDDIFLYYSKDKGAGEPLKFLYVQVVGENDQVKGAKWSRIKDWNEPHKYDLNRNAGGKDIYLWTQR